MPRPVALLALTVALACGREVVFVDPPPASSTDTTGTDTTGTDTTVVQRVDLQVTVSIAPADTALAARLGFANGRLSNAQVTARRVEGQQGPQSGTTDSLGQVTLPAVLVGTWAISALRPLSEAERALLDSADGDVTGFAGASQVEISQAATAVILEAAAGRQGTLIISEIHMPLDNQTTGYRLGQYIEVHNNSFGTVYLDGKVLGRSLPWVFPTLDLTCADLAVWREDPAGIWTRKVWAFPGDGDDYPLASGTSAIVAIDAIDHRVIHPQLLDLSGADFEFIGSNDVDNPQVPNMRNFAGWSESAGDPIGHGPSWALEVSIFLSEPVHPDSLVRDNLPVQSPPHVRVPGERILDVLSSARRPEEGRDDYCPHFVHPRFDGQYAQLVDNSSITYSIVRQALAGRPPGVRLLQRTMVSAVDFVRGTPTPGQVP